MPIAWHPTHWWDWCVPEDEKRGTEKLWDKYGIFLCLVNRYKSYLTKKGLQIMMSSLLNVSNGSSKSEKFSLTDSEVLFDSDGENGCVSRDLTTKKCSKEMILRQW